MRLFFLLISTEHEMHHADKSNNFVGLLKRHSLQL